VGGSLQAMNYVGDLDPAQNFLSPAMRYTRPNFGCFGTYRYNQRFTFRGAFSWGRIYGSDKISDTEGDDQFRRMRNANFRNTISELKFDVIYDLRVNKHDYLSRSGFLIPYVFVGIAGFYHNPKAERNGQWIPLQPLKTEGVAYSKFQVAVPFGLGVRFKLINNFDLAFEIGWRKTFTGYLDDVNRNYVDPQNQSPLAAEMANRSLDWISQPANPAQYENVEKTALRQFIKQGAPDIAYERIYYNKETDRLEFWGWGREGDQRGHKKEKADWYILTGVHLSYIIGGHISCPRFTD
jgi:hypothetical protein